MSILTPHEIAACAAIIAKPRDIARPVIEAILRETGVTATELDSGSTARRIARTRQLIMAALHDRDMTMEEIGALLGVDHSTVSHGVKAAKTRALEHAMIFKSRRAS